MARSGAARRRVMLVGPWKWTTGGVTTFMNNVARGPLGEQFDIVRFNIARPPKKNVADNYGYRAILRGGVGRIVAGALITLAHLLLFPFALMVRRPDAVQVQSSDFQVFWEASFYAWTARALGFPVLMRLGGSFDNFYGVSSSRARNAIRRVLGWPDRLIVQSEYWRKFVCKLGRVDGVVVLPNSVPDCLVESPPPACPANPVCFFSAGSEAVRKGITELMDAMRLLRDQGRSPQLHVVAATEGLQHEIEDAHLAEFIRAHGVLAHAALLEAMRQAQIFLLPSRAEGFPNTLVEAMALGLAPIVTSVGAIPEIVEGTGAIAVPKNDPGALADAIAKLSSDAALTAGIGRAAREAVRARYVHSAVMPILASAWESAIRTENR